MPLAYCFVQTNAEADKGAKELVLRRFCDQLKRRGVNPEFTLSDKDWSEINAMRAVWPDAKHQLCFWHALRAIKKRLCNSSERPGDYDWLEAQKEFAFVSSIFVPLAKQDLLHVVRTTAQKRKLIKLTLIQIPPPPDAPKYRVNLLFNGRPNTITPALPTIRIPPRDKAVVQDGNASDSGESDSGTFWGGTRNVVDDEELPELLEDDEDNDADDVRHDLQQILREPDEDNEAVVTAESDQALPATKPKVYQFCPPIHRLPILRLFAKHASQHSLLPDRHGKPRSSHDIRRDAVSEMYWHCHRNNLADVWAYLWNNWYARDRWSLWARSSHSTCISNHRTTMMVEALWRDLKRLVLRNFNRPRVDLALYALIRESIPPYRKTLAEFLHVRSGGRPQGLSNMQEAFKKAWRRLQIVPIKGEYITDTSKWTCDCGTQKYHAYLLCKHLVQAVGDIPQWWWTRVQRFYTLPFYSVPENGEWNERPLRSDRPCNAIVDAADSNCEVDDLVRERSTTPSRSSEPVCAFRCNS